MSVTVVAFVSYGNDSIALLQYLRESRDLGERVIAAFSDTGWADPTWMDRVQAGEAFARTLGFETARIGSVGFVPLVRLKKMFPFRGGQFCTEELKINPAKVWLDEVDPAREFVCAVGVRRAESAKRSTWPEWTEESDKHGGRSLWAPLVRHDDAARDELVRRAGFEILAHRSLECSPCVNANRGDLRLVAQARLDEIAALEADVGGYLFNPKKKMGARGIHEAKRWADAERGKFEPDGEGGGCDSGMCGG